MAKKEIPAGKKMYRLTEPHYRLGEYYQPGELITVSADETPGKSWLLVDADGDEVTTDKKAEKSAGERMIDETKTKKTDEKHEGKGLARPNDRTIG